MKRFTALEIGKAEIVREGSDVAIIGIGSEVSYCEKAAERLALEGVNATVVNARFVKPLDTELILALARSHGSIVTAEDHYLMGGFGSAVMELLEENKLHEVRVLRLGFPDKIDRARQPEFVAGEVRTRCGWNLFAGERVRGEQVQLRTSISR